MCGAKHFMALLRMRKHYGSMQCTYARHVLFSYKKSLGSVKNHAAAQHQLVLHLVKSAAYSLDPTASLGTWHATICPSEVREASVYARENEKLMYGQSHQPLAGQQPWQDSTGLVS
jgi:hypothetical protein